MGRKEVIRTFDKEKTKPPKRACINVYADTKKEFRKIRLKGDTDDSTLKTLINVFKDPSLKQIYDLKAISQEYYDNALEQRRLERINYFEKKSVDTGTRAYDENRYLSLRNKSPFFSSALKKEVKRKKYFNRIWFQFSDYDLETIAHLQFLTGIFAPRDVLLHCLRTTYLIYSQDRLFRNTNAELAERNIHKMLEDSVVDEETWIPIHSPVIPTEHRKVMNDLKRDFGVDSNNEVLRILVRKEYERYEKRHKENPEWYDLVGE